MAVKFYKKVSNGKIEIPTLKEYNTIKIDAIAGAEHDFEVAHPAVYHTIFNAMDVNVGDVNPYFFVSRTSASYIYQTSSDRYRIGFLQSVQYSGTPVLGSFVTCFSKLLASFYVFKDMRDAVSRWSAGISEDANLTEDTNGHFSGIYDATTVRGIEGLSTTDLQITTPAGYYYAWAYEGATPISEAVIELNKFFATADYDIFGTEAERLGFKFYKVNDNGTKVQIPYSTIIPENSYSLVSTVDALYSNDSYIFTPSNGVKLYHNYTGTVSDTQWTHWSYRYLY